MDKFRKIVLFGFLILLPLLFNPKTGDVEAIKVLCLSFVAGLLWFTQGSLKIKKTAITIGMCLLVAVIFLSTLLAQDSVLSLWGSEARHFGAFVWLMAIAFSLSASQVFSSQSARLMLLKTLVFSGTLSSLFALAIGNVWEGRFIGTLGNPNVLGQFLLFTLVCTLGLCLLERGKNKFCLLLAVLQFGVLIGTGNRASLLVFFLVLIVSLFTFLKSKRSRGYGLFFILGTMSVVSYFMWDRIVDFESIQTRLEIYQASLRAITESPFLGYGFDHANYVLDLPEFTLDADRAHQFFLDAALNTGLIGMVVLGFLVCATLLKLLKAKDPVRQIYGVALLALLLSAQVSFFTSVHLVLLFLGVSLIYQVHPHASSSISTR